MNKNRVLLIIFLTISFIGCIILIIGNLPEKQQKQTTEININLDNYITHETTIIQAPAIGINTNTPPKQTNLYYCDFCGDQVESDELTECELCGYDYCNNCGEDGTCWECEE